MPRPPNDDRSDALTPDKPADPPKPDDEPSEGGEARDQGDQTEDNKRQQE